MKKLASFARPRVRSLAASAVMLMALSGAVAAQSASLLDGENGRYALSPIADGVLRLDTRTGAVSTCANKGAGWACYAVPDERAAFDAEIGRLQKENEALRTQMAQREPAASGKTDDALPKTDPLMPRIPKTADGERKLEIPLPSDRDIDRVMGFIESAWRRLVDMAARIQKDTSGKI